MRRVLLALLAAVTLGASTAALSALPAAGETVEALDARIEVVDLLDASDDGVDNGIIAPAGSYGMYEVSAEIDVTGGDLIVETTVTGGTIDTTYSDLSACGSGSDADTCHLSVTAGTPETFRLAVLHDGTSSAVTVESTLQDDNTLLALDVDASNNSDSVTSAVGGDGSSAFVPQGDSLTFEANGQTHILTVTLAEGTGGGAIVRMDDPGLMFCGALTTTCNGVHIEFSGGASGEPFEAETEIDSTGPTDPCKGLGNDDCTGIYWRKTSDQAVLELIASCGSEGTDEPCLQQKYKLAGGQVHFVTEMDTTDPDIGLPF